jgi:F-type H+-transporting ATPase subunit b
MIATTLSGVYILWWAAQVVAVLILVVLALRWRPGFLGGKTLGQTMNGLLDARAAQIESQLQAAERSREEAARIRAESEQDIARAHAEAEAIVARAGQTSDAIRHELQERAQEEYQRIVAQAKTQIDYERQQAEMQIRRNAADVVVDAARQIVERRLDANADEAIINEAIGQIREIK